MCWTHILNEQLKQAEVIIDYLMVYFVLFIQWFHFIFPNKLQQSTTISKEADQAQYLLVWGGTNDFIFCIFISGQQ